MFAFASSNSSAENRAETHQVATSSPAAGDGWAQGGRQAGGEQWDTTDTASVREDAAEPLSRETAGALFGHWVDEPMDIGCSEQGCHCAKCAGGANKGGSARNELPQQISDDESTRSEAAGDDSVSIKVHGQTSSNFSSSYALKNEKLTTSTQCEDCGKDRCIHVTGELVSNFRAEPKISLPKASDYKGLSACQKKAVSAFIAGQLQEHENQHAAAFRTYSGTESEQIDLTGCRTQLQDELKTIHRQKDSERRQAAMDLSSLLDPFNVPIPGFDCDRKPPANADGDIASPLASDDLDSVRQSPGTVEGDDDPIFGFYAR